MSEPFMKEAIDMAVENVYSGKGGPFAAIVVKDGQVVGRGTNRVTTANDPTSHAEINAIRDACAQLGHFQLDGCIIYTTCEPCPMCMGAIYWARPAKVVYAASRRQAQDAGFDDEYIYDQIALDPDQRSLEMVHDDGDDARRPFEAWSKFEGRTEY